MLKNRKPPVADIVRDRGFRMPLNTPAHQVRWCRWRRSTRDDAHHPKATGPSTTQIYFMALNIVISDKQDNNIYKDSAIRFVLVSPGHLVKNRHDFSECSAIRTGTSCFSNPVLPPSCRCMLRSARACIRATQKDGNRASAARFQWQFCHYKHTSASGTENVTTSVARAVGVRAQTEEIFSTKVIPGCA